MERNGNIVHKIAILNRNLFRFVRKVMDEKNTDWRDSITSFVLQVKHLLKNIVVVL